jgi:signal transduction histidine kinase/CheY-like chemotaxis protein
MARSKPVRRTNGVPRLERLLGQRELLRCQNEELARIAAELEEAHERFADLFELAPLPYLILTPSGIIERANELAARLLRRHRREVEGRPLALFVSRDRRSQFRQFLLGALRQQGERSLETELPFDPPLPVHVRARRARQGQLYMALVDLSARPQPDHEWTTLEAKAESAELTSVARNRFLAVLSHELRTPLTPVLASVSALRRARLPAAAARWVEVIERSVRHEVHLVDDLLDVTRLTHGKMSFDTQVVDLHATVEEALELVAPEAEAKQLKVQRQLNAPQHHVKGDAVRLRQVFANLLRNACKFTPPGGRIKVISEVGKRGVVVQVVDSGEGIAASQLAVIFERFGQTPGSVSKGGLGLGLAIARGIVEGHSGRIGVQSRGPGRGATFEVELACVPALAAAPAPRRLPAPRPSRPQHERILLVEDHEDTAAVLSELLSAEGYQIDHARSVSEALSKADSSTELVISDIGLPDGSGLDIMRRLRAKRLRIPGIVLSGYGSREDRRQAREAGFVRHLLKPVDFEELVAVIREVRH